MFNSNIFALLVCSAKNIVVILIVFLISSCATEQVVVVEPDVVQVPIEPVLSSLPLEELTEADYRFAQTALEQLGYDVVYIDGIWGPRSAAAIQEFEKDNQLITANGRLSELNITRLSEATRLQRQDFAETLIVQPTNISIDKRGIAAKLDPSVPLGQSPQLIITDLSYDILAKPNPYSETITQLPQGAGLYVIGLQEGWYEVETLDRERGYISE
ncbi:MAG: peptidoglycan-binding protein [Acidiferrobacterales bacterium]|nr:peptidoglycan-binding protein [Acidiferrobacterales bacterium]